MNGLLNLKQQIKRNLVFLFTAGLLFWTSITLLLPILPAYIQDVGGTTQQVGLVMGCFAIGLLCSRTWLGQIADRRSRKIVIVIGTIVAGTAPLGYIFIQSIQGLAAMRAFHGISIAAFTVGYSALVVDFAPRKHRGKLIGYMNLAVPLGMSVGPALGGFLQKNTNYPTLFAVSAACGLGALLLSSQLRELSQKELNLQHPGLEQPVRDFQQLISNSALVIPGIVLFLVGLVFGTLVAFLPLYVRELDIAFNVGLFYTVVAIASFTVRILIGKISDSYGRGILITISLIFYMISMVLLAKANSAEMLLLAGAAEGIGAGILIPTMLALISDRSYSNERGKVYALCLGGFDVGIALAGPVLGFLESYLSYRGVFGVATILAAIAFVIFVTRSNKNLARSWGFALGREKDVFALD
ncbi:Arabinose efflux permease family protein [Hyella patelloides LEGE 07179]|uniref:Arabinose efflux permease family protein n=1 Tax=Hyella patelloides LEGE 07179 TaxID=945734 RepID=A0A563VX47_9CYAN|nr:MFS transporter [Hyella patelloides]VEP15957.1 Arabinose efflux permease family protein [Hyella patelloides LEGE 07179]